MQKCQTNIPNYTLCESLYCSRLTCQVVLRVDTLDILPRLWTVVDLAPQTACHTAPRHSIHTFTSWTIVGSALHLPVSHLSTQVKGFSDSRLRQRWFETTA